MQELPLTISAVERDVGVSKEVLRVWERRYGFPSPTRNAHGERLYPADQVERLRLVRRLMDQGHRPGRLLSAPKEALEEALAQVRQPPPQSRAAPARSDVGPLLEQVCRHDSAGFQRALLQRLAGEGLRNFVQDTVAPLSAAIGLAWEQGRLQVFEEHLCTELMAGTLRQAIAAVPRGSAPRVLLTTVPHEPHGLGLLMAEAMLALEGAQCTSLGTQTPPGDILRAAQACGADVVALSFSSAFPPRQVPQLLSMLRAALPATVQLWVGGAGAGRGAARLPGVDVLAGLTDIAGAVRAWHEQQEAR